MNSWLVRPSKMFRRTVDRILKGEAKYGETEAEAAAMGYQLLTKIAEDADESSIVNIAYIYHAAGNRTRVSRSNSGHVP